MVYFPVYSPLGEFFEVPRHVADKLLLEEGWTQSKPTFVEVAAVDDPESSETEADAEAAPETPRTRARQ